MVLIILLFCYFGQIYSCVRTADVSTTTLAPGVTATLPPGATTTLAPGATTIAGQTTTTVAGQTTTASTTTAATTTTSENLALTCQATDVQLRVQPNFTGHAPTAGPVTVTNGANTMTITCMATVTPNTMFSINDGMTMLPPAPTSTQTITCNSQGQWTITPPGSAPVAIMSASCNDAP